MADLSETEMAERLRRLEEEIYGQSPALSTELDGRGEMEFRNLKSVDTESVEMNETYVVSTSKYGGENIIEAFNNAKSERGTQGVKYIIPAGDYGDVPTTWNLSRSPDSGGVGEPWHVTARGVSINFTTNGDPAIEQIGGNGYLTVDVSGSKIIGDSSQTPSVGLLLARHSDNESPMLKEWVGGELAGSFQHATFYNIGAETLNFRAQLLRNNNGSARSVLTNIAENVDGVSGVYEDAFAASGENVTRNTFDSSIIGDGPTCLVYLGHSQNTEFNNNYMAALTSADTFVRFDCSDGPAYGPYTFDNVRTEGDSADSFADAVAPSSGVEVIRFLNVRGGTFASDLTYLFDMPDGVMPRDWSIGIREKINGKSVSNTLRLQDSGGNVTTGVDADIRTVGPIVSANNAGIGGSEIIGDPADIPISDCEDLLIKDPSSSEVVFANGEKVHQFNFNNGNINIRGTMTENASDADYF